jgi:hypothetical protein
VFNNIARKLVVVAIPVIYSQRMAIHLAFLMPVLTKIPIDRKLGSKKIKLHTFCCACRTAALFILSNSKIKLTGPKKFNTNSIQSNILYNICMFLVSLL